MSRWRVAEEVVVDMVVEVDTVGAVGSMEAGVDFTEWEAGFTAAVDFVAAAWGASPGREWEAEDSPGRGWVAEASLDHVWEAWVAAVSAAAR